MRNHQCVECNAKCDVSSGLHRCPWCGAIHSTVGHAVASLAALLFLVAIATLALHAQTAVVRTSAELDSAMRTAKPGSTILLTPGTYKLSQHVGSLRFERERPLTIRSLDIGQPATLDCASNCYISGALGVTIEHVALVGRMNWDAAAAPGKSGALLFRYLAATDAKGWQENLKLTHLDGVTIEYSSFVRSGVGMFDRPVNAVGVSGLTVQNSYFERCFGGCIQSKGGAVDTVIRRNLINGGGGRAIQLGGSTCPTCWRGEPGPYESIGGEVYDNVIVATSACFVLSTQKGGRIHHNTCYLPRDSPIPNANGTHGGGQYLFQLLQEPDPAMPAGVIQPSTGGSIDHNLFLYAVMTDDGRAGINAAVTNWAANAPVDFGRFTFAANAVYAVSPIVNPSFGARQIYPHRHPGAKPPLTPYDWQAGLLDQVYPGVIDWGLPTMRPLAKGYGDIGARVSPSDPAGVPGMLLPADKTAPAPLRPEEYPADQPLYGWEWPGWDGPLPGDQAPPAASLYILTLKNGTVLLFDSELAALEWLAGSTIERVERAR